MYLRRHVHGWFNVPAGAVQSSGAAATCRTAGVSSRMSISSCPSSRAGAKPGTLADAGAGAAGDDEAKKSD